MPTKLKRLLKPTEQVVKVNSPLSFDEIKQRHRDYQHLSPKRFSRRTLNAWTQPASLTYHGKKYDIEVNFCVNPFCQWFGQPQEPLDSQRKQLYRYKLSGKGEGLNRSCFACNDDKYNPHKGYVSNDTPTALSNWSVANEIARLARQNTVVNWDPDYDFHYVGCDDKNLTPFSSREAFSAYGLSKSNSQRWKCSTCKKITNTLPDQNSCYTYRPT